MRVTNESTTLITFQILISTFEIWNEKQNQNKNSRSGVLQWQALQHKLKIWIQTMLTYNYDVYVCSNVSYQFIFVQLHVQPIHFLLTLVRQFHQHSRRNKNKTTQTLDIIITRTKTTPMSNIVCLWLLSPRSDCCSFLLYLLLQFRNCIAQVFVFEEIFIGSMKMTIFCPSKLIFLFREVVNIIIVSIKDNRSKTDFVF